MISLNRQRREVQLRRLQLAGSRLRLHHNVAAVGRSLRCRLTSPSVLMASLALGWLYGRTQRRPSPVHQGLRSHVSLLVALGASLDRLVRMLAGSPMLLLLMRRLLARPPAHHAED